MNFVQWMQGIHSIEHLLLTNLSSQFRPPKYKSEYCSTIVGYLNFWLCCTRNIWYEIRWPREPMIFEPAQSMYTHWRKVEHACNSHIPWSCSYWCMRCTLCRCWSTSFSIGVLSYCIVANNAHKTLNDISKLVLPLASYPGHFFPPQKSAWVQGYPNLCCYTPKALHLMLYLRF